MKKGTRADRRLKQEQRRGIVTMGRVGEGKSYLVDMYGRKREFQSRPQEDTPPSWLVAGMINFMFAVATDTKEISIPPRRINPPGIVDLTQREDGVYE